VTALPAAVLATLLAWGAFEIGLLLRDRARGMGSTARDHGTRGFYVLSWASALVAARLITGGLHASSAWQAGRWTLSAAVTVMWIGLVIRVWAIVVLGQAFRTTVEVEPDQPVVDRGPYRLVRHPSYTGMLLISVGIGLGFGNWPSLAILVLLPLVATLRRIAVEEAALAEVLGQPYVSYQQRTKRLVPLVW
jgi:protein-S-isoprenylcysteine O-methyltransferase Ste14